MKAFRSFVEFCSLIKENDAQRSYACLMLDCRDFQPYLKKIQRSIDPNDVYDDEEGHGLENDPHITVLYGIHEQDPESVKDQLDLGPAKYILKDLSLFENEKFDVLKCTVESPDLHDYNNQCRERLEYTSSFPDYVPHLTVAYLLPGTGKKYLKLESEAFGKEKVSNKYTFSDKDSNKDYWTV